MTLAISKDYLALKRLIKAIEEFDESEWCDLPEWQYDDYTLPQNELTQDRGNSFYELF